MWKCNLIPSFPNSLFNKIRLFLSLECNTVPHLFRSYRIGLCFFFFFFWLWYHTLNIVKIILRFVHTSCTCNHVNVRRTTKVCEISWFVFLRWLMLQSSWNATSFCFQTRIISVYFLWAALTCKDERTTFWRSFNKFRFTSPTALLGRHTMRLRQLRFLSITKMFCKKLGTIRHIAEFVSLVVMIHPSNVSSNRIGYSISLDEYIYVCTYIHIVRVCMLHTYMFYSITPTYDTEHSLLYWRPKIFFFLILIIFMHT